ncbi:MFS transporter [Hoyosella subflava]|uniref:MFS transporter n=1 Tax=Hoyosella subflava TaxID=639313 RepID=UPI0002DDF4CC|nr:MFS transporter [Hoyosella subflava]
MADTKVWWLAYDFTAMGEADRNAEQGQSGARREVSSGPVWTAPGMPALLVMTAFGFSGHALLFPTVPLWVVTTGGNAAGAGAVNALLMLCTVLTQVLVPFALRRIGWNITWKLGMVFLGVPSLLHLLPLSFAGALALAVPRGFGFGVLTVCGAIAVAELVHPARRGKAIGAYGLAIAAPQAILIPAAPWVADNIGFALVFVAGACPLIGWFLAGPVARHVTSTSREADDRTTHGTRRRVRIPIQMFGPMLILLAVTAAGGALLTFTPQMTPNPTLVFTSLLTFTVISALSRWLIGAFADRYGTRLFVTPLIGLTAAGLSLIAWAVQGSGALQSAGLIVGMAIVGISYGALQNLTLLDTFAAAGRKRYGMASAVWNIGFDAGTGIGALLIGIVAAQATFSVAMLAAALLSILTLPLAVASARRRRQ